MPDIQISGLPSKGSLNNNDSLHIKDGSDSGDYKVTPSVIKDKVLELAVGDSPQFDGLSITNSIVVGGLVDGRDVAADGTILDNINLTGVSALTSAEVDQLENIGSTTINSTQWGYVGAMDQGVATTDSHTCAGQVVNGAQTVTGAITSGSLSTSSGIAVGDSITIAGDAIVGQNASTAVALEVGQGRTVDGASFIDLVGDTTYIDFGLRVLRSAGANAASEIAHRGAGTLNLTAIDAGNVAINTNGQIRVLVDSSGNTTLNGNQTINAPDIPVTINSENSNIYKIQFEDVGTARGYVGASSTDCLVVANSALSTLFSINATTGNALLNGAFSNTAGASIGQDATTDIGVEIAPGRTVDGSSLIDLIGDTTYTDYGLRVIRGGGANAASEIAHRGTGTLNITATDAGNVAINVGGATALVAQSDQVVRPGADNTKSIGNASFRWSEVFAGNATINTSDETLKTPIQPIEQLEKEALLTCHALIGKYQMLDSVDRKGADNARWHFGLGAQSAIAEFESRGLDWTKYSFFCRDEIPVYETQLVTEKQPKIETLTRTKKTIKVIEGVPTQIEEVEEYDSPMLEYVGVVDETGAPVLDDNGDQLTHPVPVMVDVEVEEQVQVGTVERYGIRYEHLLSGILASLPVA